MAIAGTRNLQTFKMEPDRRREAYTGTESKSRTNPPIEIGGRPRREAADRTLSVTSRSRKKDNHFDVWVSYFATRIPDSSSTPSTRERPHLATQRVTRESVPAVQVFVPIAPTPYPSTQTPASDLRPPTPCS